MVYFTGLLENARAAERDWTIFVRYGIVRWATIVMILAVLNGIAYRLCNADYTVKSSSMKSVSKSTFSDWATVSFFDRFNIVGWLWTPLTPTIDCIPPTTSVTTFARHLRLPCKYNWKMTFDECRRSIRWGRNLVRKWKRFLACDPTSSSSDYLTVRWMDVNVNTYIYFAATFPRGARHRRCIFHIRIIVVHQLHGISLAPCEL